MSFPTRKIGNESIAAIGFGAMGLSAFYGNRVDDEESIKVIHKAIELAGDAKLMIDTADMYGVKMGDNERLLAKALKDPAVRSKVFLATKFANHMAEDGTRSIRGSPEYVRSAIEASLKDLQMDSVDLYYQHRVDRTVPIEDTWNELKKLKEEGKVKYLGISEATSEEMRKAHAITPITACQIEFSPWTPDILDNGIMDTCKELGITIVAYSPLGRGFLTGQYKSIEDFEEGDFRRYSPRFQGENFKKNLELVDALKKIADAKNCTAGQLALAWTLEQGTLPIPGTKKEKYLIENMDAVKVNLSKKDLEEIASVISSITTTGGRYPEGFAAAGAF